MSDRHIFTHPGSTVWPSGLRAAVAVIVIVDAPTSTEPRSLNDPGLDYTPVGLRRLLAIFDDIDISVTTAWTRTALSQFPELLRSTVQSDHEVALAFATGIPDHGDWFPEDIPVAGYVEGLPGRQVEFGAGRDATLYQWRVTGSAGDHPIATNDGAIILPTSPYWIDRAWFDAARPLPPSSLLEAWSLSLGEVRTEAGLMTVVLHSHISGRPGIAGQITRFLDDVIATGDTWIANAAAIADWWLQSAPAAR